MWQSVCSIYCCQLKAVIFNTGTFCCTVQIHVYFADFSLFRYTARNFSVLMWMWQSVCSSYCRQLNAVSFNTGTSCCTVQMHVQFTDLILFGYTAGIFTVLPWIWQELLVCYCECGSPSVPVTPPAECCQFQHRHFILHCIDPCTVCWLCPL